VNFITNRYAAEARVGIFGILNQSGEPAVPNIVNLVMPSIKATGMNKLWMCI
jgi:hypothetical protein